MSYPDKKNISSSDRVFINHNIRVPQVLCIDQDNKNLGVIATSQAMVLATQVGLDLVQIAAPGKDRPPTCKIMDYGKYKFDLSKKKKEAEKKQREQQHLSEPKEIKFRPVTDFNDLQVKARKAEEFLAEGYKVKLSIVFKGRELSHKEIAYDTLNQFMECISTGQLIQSPSMSENGKALNAMLVRKNDDNQ